MSQAVLNEKTFAPDNLAAGYAAMPSTTDYAPMSQTTQGIPSVPSIPRSGTMTVGGTVAKTLVFLALTLAFASVGWNAAASVLNTSPLLFFGGFILLIALSYAATKNPKLAAVVGVVYAILMGTWMGAISRIYNEVYDGIVLQAVAASLSVFIVCLGLYASRVVKVTARFQAVVITATVGVLVLYLGSFVLSLFGVNFLNQPGSPLAIGISVVICIIAALNLFLDFKFIEQGATTGAPKAMEWLGAFGLLTTLVWLYLEMLRLLALLQGDR
jgi:uncharacterized YccA/Bax inhibitor family protein